MITVIDWKGVFAAAGVLAIAIYFTKKETSGIIADLEKVAQKIDPTDPDNIISNTLNVPEITQGVHAFLHPQPTWNPDTGQWDNFDESTFWNMGY